MRIGIIGAGNIGQAAAARLVAAGHEVMLSNAGLIEDMGFDPVDAGSLLDGRNQQPGTPVYGLTADAESVRAAVGNSSEP